MDRISLQELLTATKGELLTPGINGDTLISGVQSDNRKCSEGDVFFAFIGENTDGHSYVNSALENGAAGAVVSKAPEKMLPDKFYVRVSDTLLAAGDLARYYRSKFSIPVIGVTGSVGKTTMKDMIASVLSEKFNVIKTEANFNNNIGLPRTLFRIDHTTEVAVVEMGMNHMKEIEYLTGIARPTMAVITNVGEAHIGNLGSRENIFRAKCEIFEGLEKGGLAVMNADDEFLPRLKGEEEMQSSFRFVWTGESDSADLRAVCIQDSLDECVRFDIVSASDEKKATTSARRVPVTVPALGRHMIYPSLAAAAIGRELGMTWDEIACGIRDYVPTAKRMETWHLRDNITVYNDTYNANPQSMKAGLTTLASTKGTARIAVLGDMLELGDMEEELHRGVGDKAAEVQVDTLITVGRRAAFIADEALKKGLSDVRHYENNAQALDAVLGLIQAGSVIYLKASHAMAFDTLASDLKQALEQ